MEYNEKDIPFDKAVGCRPNSCNNNNLSLNS